MPALTIDPASAARASDRATAAQQHPATTAGAIPRTLPGAAPGATTTTMPGVRPASPVRPPMSPITPPLNATQLPPSASVPSSTTMLPDPAVPAFAQGRPQFRHTSQADQAAAGAFIPPPASVPISFDENPDALALQSAISILQMQRARATADMVALERAKKAAIAHPAAFAADLEAGRIKVVGERLFVGAGVEEDEESESSGEDESEEEGHEDEDVANEGEGRSGGSEGKFTRPDGDGTSTAGVQPSTAAGDSSSQAGAPSTSADTSSQPKAKPRRKRKGKEKSTAEAGSSTVADPKAWRTLPKPQNVVRCPPINWAQYGVVGESFDKLHAEQVAAPSQGRPIVLGPGGTFEFRAGDPMPTQGEHRKLVGVAAPYAPGKDRLDKKKKR